MAVGMAELSLCPWNSLIEGQAAGSKTHMHRMDLQSGSFDALALAPLLQEHHAPPGCPDLNRERDGFDDGAEGQ